MGVQAVSKVMGLHRPTMFMDSSVPLNVPIPLPLAAVIRVRRATIRCKNQDKLVHSRQGIALGLHLRQLSPVDHLFHGCIPLSLQLLQLPQQARPVTAQRVDLITHRHVAHRGAPFNCFRIAWPGENSNPWPGSNPFSAQNSMTSMAATSRSSY